MSQEEQRVVRHDFTLADVWWIYVLSQALVFAVAAVVAIVSGVGQELSQNAIIVLLVLSPVILIGLVVAFGFARGRLDFLKEKLRVQSWPHVLAWGVGVAVVARLIGGVILYFEESYDVMPVVPNNPFIDQLSNLQSGWGLVVAGLAVVVVGPIAEELFYRAVVLRVLKKHLAEQPALIISALIFGAVHFNLGLLVPLALAGYLLGLIYLRLDSLVPAMLAHGLFNAIAVVAGLLQL